MVGILLFKDLLKNLQTRQKSQNKFIKLQT